MHTVIDMNRRRERIRRQPDGIRVSLDFPVRTSDLETLWRDLLERLESDGVASRLWAKDPALFSPDPETQAAIHNRLGWLDSPQWLSDHLDELISFAAEIRSDGFEHVLLLGMGGSSLCPEVLSRVLRYPAWLKSFAIVDSTHPDFIRRVERQIDLRTTLFVVASKSGGTIETRTQADYFLQQVSQITDQPGRQFVAITDSGSALESWATEKHFRKTFLNPADIGGRFSALSYFGMIPAALLGFPIAEAAASLHSIVQTLKAGNPYNRGIQIAAFIVAATQSGLDKLSFRAPGRAMHIVPWIEQLVAESTGKSGTGVIPIDADPPQRRSASSKDRLWCTLRLESDQVKGASPIPGFLFEFAQISDLLSVFFMWEYITAIAGNLLGINPFDEPNVRESKDITGRLLDEFQSRGRFSHLHAAPADTPLHVVAPATPDLDGALALRNFISAISAGDYVTFLYFGDRVAAAEQWLQHLRAQTAQTLGVATLRGYGPRYLHSIGQLYKGGAPKGHFIVITHTPESDIAIPGRPYSFGNLVDAQAFGDIEALMAHQRPVVHVHMTGPRTAEQGEFATLWNSALRAVKAVILE